MSGSLWEWCADWWGDGYPTSNANPTGPANGTERALRGGAWVNAYTGCQTGSRGGHTPSYVNFSAGFRCARTLDVLYRLPDEMCDVPAGTFRTSTGVEVSLNAYRIDKYEVTNKFYCDFLNDGGNDDHWHSENTEIAKDGPGSYHVAPGVERRPVRWVNWHDAVAFCDWRSAAEGLPAGSYHLPTEAQWEKAAGWDPVEQKLWKYAIQSDSISCETVNYSNCVGDTTEVAHYAENTSYYGCHDMSGNVWEWCADRWGGTYPSSTLNPTGSDTGDSCLLRGGAWDYSATHCETGYRGGNNFQWAVLNNYGFRCARTLD